MILSYSSNKYRITFDGVSMVENALGNPNLVQIALTSGCTIQVAPDEVYGITYKPNGEYAEWRLDGINTRLNRIDEHYIYARINRADDKGLIIFSVNRYRTDGKIFEKDAEMTSPTPEEPMLKGDYFYILIGKITSTDSLENPTAQREITLDGGYLTTPQGTGSMNDMFRIIAGNLIQPLKRMASHIVEGTLEIVGHAESRARILLNGKEMSDIARNCDAQSKEPDDQTVPTTAYLTGNLLDFLSNKFLRKDREDTANEIITFLKGLKVGRFVSGLIGGIGAQIDENGNGEMNSLVLRESLIVPKITFNCIDVISGDKANTFAFGTIKEVDTAQQIATLDLLNDELGTLKIDDICRGVFHNIEGNNQSADAEDANGFYSYAGFSTSYFSPTEIIENVAGSMKFRYVLQPGTVIHPMSGMNFFAYGNFNKKKKDRHGLTYETRYYTRRLKDVMTWKINPDKNISMQDGLLDGLTIGGMTMHGYGTFQENTYLTGVTIQFTPEQKDELAPYSVDITSYSGVVKDSATSLTTNIIVTKGSTKLQQGAHVDKNTYIVSLDAHGCTASAVDGVVTMTQITADGYVDISVNCEGNYATTKRYSFTKIADAVTTRVPQLFAYTTVIRKDENGVNNPQTIRFAVIEYKGSDVIKHEISVPADRYSFDVYIDGDFATSKLRDIDVSNAQKSVNASLYQYREGGGVVMIGNIDIPVISASSKGDDAVIYDMVPSANCIKIDRDGNYSVNRIIADIVESIGLKTEVYRGMLPDNSSMIAYVDGVRDTYILSTGVNVSSAKKEVKLEFYKGNVCVDRETIPVLRDGTDGESGESSIVLDLENEVASVACDPWGYIIEGQTLPYSDVWMFYGTQSMTIDSVTFPNQPSWIDIRWDDREHSIKVDFIQSGSPNVMRIKVRATASYNGVSYTRDTIFTINKIMEGEPGENGKFNEDIYIVSDTQPSTPTDTNKIPLGWSTTIPAVIPLEVDLTEEGNWMHEENFIRSDKISNNGFTKHKILFDFPIQTKVYVEMTAFCEKNYDKGFIGKLDMDYTAQPSSVSETLRMVTGNGISSSVVVEVPSGQHYIELLYTKDGSGSNYGDYVKARVVVLKRIWHSVSEAVKGAQSVTYEGWSEPNLYNIMTGEESIYLLTELKEDLVPPFSNPDVNGYLPRITDDTYDSSVTYLIGQKVTYEGKFYRCIEQSLGNIPTNTEFWAEIHTWTREPQDVSEKFRFQYCCKRKLFNGAWGGWSKPSVYSMYGKGEKGADGAMPRYCGVWKKGAEYVYDDNYRDIVIYNGQKYQVYNRYTTVPVNTPPNITSGDHDEYWQIANKFSFVAMDTAFIDKANIAGFMFARHPDSTDDNVSGILRSQNNASDGTPIFEVDTKTGKLKAKDVEISGTVNATGGQFVNVDVDGVLRSRWFLVKFLSGNDNEMFSPWGYDIAAIRHNNLVLEFCGIENEQINIPWGENADGRDLKMVTPNTSVKIYIPEGYFVYTDSGRHQSTYTLQANYLYRLTGFADFWIIERGLHITDVGFDTWSVK